MNNVERDWSGSIGHTSYRLGRCSNTEEAQRSPRTPLSPHMLYTYSTGQSQESHITLQPVTCYTLHTIPLLQHYTKL